MNKIFSRFLNIQSKTITSAAVLLGVAGLASRFLGMIRERLLVGTFGAGNILDGFFAAFQIPDFAYNLLIAATLSVAFIPVFCEYLNTDKKEAWRIANSILNIVILVMGALCLLFFLFAPQFVRLVSPGFSGEKYQMTVNLTRILLLSPLLFAISSIFSSILNSFRSFTAMAVAPLLYNLGIILGILFLAPLWGIYGVVAGVIFGALMHILVQVPSARKFGFGYRAILDWKNKGVKEIIRLIVPRFFSIDISQISQLVGTIIGSTLIAGSVAIFNLVYNIEAVPVGVFAISFVVAAFPALSQSAAQKDKETFRKNLSYVMRQILFFLIPLAILTFIFRAQVVRLVIGTKKLSWDETRLAAATLAIFGFSFIFQGISMLLARAFFAFKNAVLPLIISLASIALNIAATYLFLDLFNKESFFTKTAVAFLKLDGLSNIGILALPAGFSAAAIFSAFLLFLALRLKFGRLDGKRIGAAFLKYLLAGLAAGIVGYAALYFIEPYLNTFTFLGILIQLIFATFFAGVIFVLICLALKSEEMMNLINSIRGKIFKSVDYLDVSETEQL